MTYQETMDLCWKILGEGEKEETLLNGSTAEAMNDALSVMWAVEHENVTDYASFMAWYDE